MRVEELQESRSAPLYHLMTHIKALYVFENDRLDPRWEHNVPGLGEVRGNSLTRNPRFRFGLPYWIRLTIDQDALSRRHRILPLDAEFVHAHTIGSRSIHDRRYNPEMGRDEHVFAEEFVVGPVEQLHRYLRRIEINPCPPSRVSRAGSVIEAAKSYANRFAIPIEVDPKLFQQIEEWKRYWDEDE